ncbi:hypothetical protein Ddye_006666 [Dipteronia dyeriana]|uniref:Uncharacterized protein n=1 Tax=Dipteronia dyeriana TaxID=168575 RepID=A0AAE0CRE5_9ROSI|nr:hypothetical protein Ddye_006666 [Dipteronia dyeriana]
MLVEAAWKIEKLQRNFFWRDGIEKRKIHAIDWVTDCKSKANGGFSIRRMLVKTNGLLAIWVWRFGREESSLWKKLVCAKYQVGGCGMSWNWQSKVASSFFVKIVFKLLKPCSSIALLLNEGLNMVLRCEDNMDF